MTFGSSSQNQRSTRNPLVSIAPLAVATLVLIAGTAAAVHYSRAGLSLAHYDARAHLVVARRVLDSLTPGWQQVGAVWLPLPHILNALPVQVDAWYRSGASGIALSVLSMALGAWAVSRLVITTTGSAIGGFTAAALLLANPNVLYLQSTPMTEPMLIGLTLVAIALTADWIARGAPGRGVAPGLAIAMACLVRYEAWPIAAALIALGGVVLLRTGVPLVSAVRACAWLTAFPAIALVLFSANSRWTTGTWFVPAGFFVPENNALGDAGLAFEQVRESVYLLSGSATVWPAYAAVVGLVAAFALSKRRAPLLLLIALTAAAVLPWYAFYQGHPLRVRYGVPLVAACAAMTGAGIALLWAPARIVAAAAVLWWAIGQGSPLERGAPVIVEAQRDAQNLAGRRAVTDYLRRSWDGSPIMMSMGSLAHYMHDLSHAGFRIRDFLHEGNDDVWKYAAWIGPRGFVKWVIVEERAEGGDVVFLATKRDRIFLQGFDRVAEGGGVALYRAR
jgi:hypothetical protein